MAATQREVSSTSPDLWSKVLLSHCCTQLQVMKMVMPLLSPAAGKLIFQLPEGAILNSNDLIARLELDSPDAVVAAEQFKGTFPELGPPQVSSHGVDHRFQQARTAAEMTLAGACQCMRTLGFEQASDCLDGHASARSTMLLASGTHCRPEGVGALL